MDYEADPPCPLIFNSLPLTLYSPTLSVLVKAAWEGDEGKVSSMQISLLSTCQDEPRVSVARLTPTHLAREMWPLGRHDGG